MSDLKSFINRISGATEEQLYKQIDDLELTVASLYELIRNISEDYWIDDELLDEHLENLEDFYHEFMNREIEA